MRSLPSHARQLEENRDHWPSARGLAPGVQGGEFGGMGLHAAKDQSKPEVRA